MTDFSGVVPERETLRAAVMKAAERGFFDAETDPSPDVVLALLDRLDGYEEALRKIAENPAAWAGFRSWAQDAARRALSVSEENPG